MVVKEALLVTVVKKVFYDSGLDAENLNIFKENFNQIDMRMFKLFVKREPKGILLKYKIVPCVSR